MDKSNSGKGADLVFETVGEGALIAAMAAIGWIAHQPLIFASLGPTAYEQIDKPGSRSSSAYNIIVVHIVGLGCGFLALYFAHAWYAPDVMSARFVSPQRIAAAVLAVVLTTVGTLLLKARQPAATATSLLVALGSMQTQRDALAIIAAVLIITILGEPLKRMRKKRQHIAQN